MPNLRKKFSKIYDKNVSKIYRFIYLKVNSEDVAQDLASEAFLRTWERLNKKKDESIENPRAFLYRTARNLVIDHYREKGRSQIIPFESSWVADPRQDLEKKMINKSDLDLVKKALLNIKEDYQTVIIWRYLDELSISEIAKILDKSEQATRVMIHRAVKSLKNEFS